jgi:hypothetical protein
MRKLTMAAAVLAAWSMVSACAATHSSQTPLDTTPYTTTTPTVELLACVNYYNNGCLPWQERRFGPRGWACYPC